MRMDVLSKLRFYPQLIFYKLISPFECRNYQFKVFINEFELLFYALLKFKSATTTRSKELLLKTRFGNFFVRETLFDIETASPAFERVDINKLISLIIKEILEGVDVTFNDIGAGFGKYTVAIAKLANTHGSHLKTVSFEPDPVSFKLLSKNVRENKLKNVRLFNVALSNHDGLKRFYYFKPAKMIVSFKTSEQITVKTAKLDSIFKNPRLKFKSKVFVKIDVEGHEVEVLQGAKHFFDRYNGATMLIEDAFDVKRLTQYLSKNFHPLAKLSIQNSFWEA